MVILHLAAAVSAVVMFISGQGFAWAIVAMFALGAAVAPR